jgi:nitrogen fixation/metabolism regulation signal transduction histidine kinase
MNNLIRKIANMSLQIKIAITFMVMVLLMLSVLGSIFYSNTANAIKESKQSELNTIAYETADKIDRFIFERLGDVQVLSDSKVLTMDGISEGVRLDYLNNVILAYKTYEGIFVSNLEGAIRLSSGEIPDISGIIVKINSERPYTSGLMLNKDNKRVIIFSRPLINLQGIRTGSVATVMSLDSILAIVDNVKIGATGYAELSINEKNEVPNNMTYVSSPINSFENSGMQWRVDIYQEKSEAFKVINDFIKYFILISIATLILFFFLSIVISRIITEPIRRLMDKMRQMIKVGGEEKTAGEGKNEIGSLSSSFNSLLEQLNFMMQMVLEKTGEAADMSEINENIKDIFEAIPNGILTIDSSGQITSINKTAGKILKLEPILTKGLSIFKEDIMENQDFFKIIANSLKHGRKYRGEIFYIPIESGEDIPIVFNTLRQVDKNGELIGMTVIINLLADKKKRDETVIRAKRLSELGQMSAGMAHEIRNPLASIKGYAQCARLEFSEDQQMYHDLTIILNEVERLDLIIERFMNFALPNKPIKRKVSMSELIDETIKLMKNDFAESGIIPRFTRGENDKILIDADQIKQVIINLLLNSIQASSTGDKIQVTIFRNEEDGMLAIEIIDQGTGIKEEIIDEVFTPFYTTKDKGSGLGLSISTRIIQNHGGTLEIQNAPSRGVKVLIKLPLEGELENEKE